MLMSTTERFVEFGVLRTNGWSQGNILTLVTLESAYPGAARGHHRLRVGDLIGTSVANQFISGGLQLMPPWLLALGIACRSSRARSGLYPAWRAARLVPMDAIRWVALAGMRSDPMTNKAAAWSPWKPSGCAITSRLTR